MFLRERIIIKKYFVFSFGISGRRIEAVGDSKCGIESFGVHFKIKFMEKQQDQQIKFTNK